MCVAYGMWCVCVCVHQRSIWGETWYCLTQGRCHFDFLRFWGPTSLGPHVCLIDTPLTDVPSGPKA